MIKTESDFRWLTIAFGIVIGFTIFFVFPLGLMQVWNYSIVKALTIANPIGYSEAMGMWLLIVFLMMGLRAK